MLAEIYNWFIEGFDTKDLQEAKTLLDELSGVRYAPLTVNLPERESVCCQ